MEAPSCKEGGGGARVRDMLDYGEGGVDGSRGGRLRRDLE